MARIIRPRVLRRACHTLAAMILLTGVLAFDVTTLIVDDPVKRVDNMTMAWGLEARVPFLDQEAGRTGGLYARKDKTEIRLASIHSR